MELSFSKLQKTCSQRLTSTVLVRKEDLLTTPDELQKMWILRKILNPMGLKWKRWNSSSTNLWWRKPTMSFLKL